MLRKNKIKIQRNKVQKKSKMGGDFKVCNLPFTFPIIHFQFLNIFEILFSYTTLFLLFQILIREMREKSWPNSSNKKRKFLLALILAIKKS